MKKYNVIRVTACLLALACVIGGTWLYTFSEIPSDYTVCEGDALTITSFYDITQTIVDRADDSYSLDVRYLGVLPVKTVKVNIVKPQKVVAGGQSFGLRLKTDGVLVIGISEDDKGFSPAEKAGIRKGDVIIAVNGSPIPSNAALNDLVRDCGGKPLTFSVLRDGKEAEMTVMPAESEDGYKIGLWVRDSIAGIGTITYYDTQNGVFAALGHGINDADTGSLIPLLTGSVFRAAVTGIKKGVSGTPGELKGLFLENEPIGTLYKNIGEGVFGLLESDGVPDGPVYDVAYKQDIKEGPATILCTLDGQEIGSYDIRIERVMLASGQTTKNMILRVTDETLLEKTGGIVQGMSGSPIIQNGKLVGAVTHVLINSPETGYGIFIENMIDREAS